MKFPYLQELSFRETATIRDVMVGFSRYAYYTQSIGFGLVVDFEGRCIGVVTDGDIRRRLAEGWSVDTHAAEVMTRDFVFAGADDSSHRILRLFEQGFRHIPVLDAERRPVDILQFSDFTAWARMASRIVRARAPVRISFAGGGTDMSFFFNSEPGCVLSATINKYSYATLGIRRDEKIRIISKDYDTEVVFDRPEAVCYGDDTDLIKACVRLMKPGFGFDLETYSEIDPGTGLGGSSAVSAAVVGALNHFYNENHLDRYQLADLAYQAERVELGIAGGWQDQYAAVFGGLNLIEFRQDEIVVVPLRIPREVMLELHFNLLLFRFGASRRSGAIASDQQRSFESSREEKRRQYRELAHLALEMKDVLLRGDLPRFGRLLHRGWELKRGFSSKISNSAIDAMYGAARRAGAVGGKVLGAGGGGYLLLFCPPGRQPAVTEAMAAHGAKPEHFDFVKNGLEVWTTNSTEANGTPL